MSHRPDALDDERRGRRTWIRRPRLSLSGPSADSIASFRSGLVQHSFGLLLWRSARDVALWADTPPERRGELFRGEGRLALLTATDIPPEAGLDLCRAAIAVFLHTIREEQRTHATAFLLDELERLHVAAGVHVPVWLTELRFRGWGGRYEM